MAGSDHWVCACEWPEVRTGIREGRSECPNIAHSHKGSQGDQLRCSAICPQGQLGILRSDTKGKHALKDVGLGWMSDNERWRGLLDILILASELPRRLERVCIYIPLRVITHPFESRFCRHVPL